MELDCEFIKVSNGYTCHIKSASITQPGTRVKAINGQRQAGMENSDVTEMRIDNCTVNFIPRGFKYIFPNLVEICIQNCKLQEIWREDLSGFEQLEVLILMWNDLTFLPDDLFVDMRKLKRIDFRDNKIEFMSSKLLEPIMENEIEFIDFDDNKRIDDYYYPGSNYNRNVKTVADLMRIIDEKCLKPSESEIYKRKFKADEMKQKLLTDHQSGLNKSFADYLWSTGDFSDFVVVSGAKKFRVHKLVLVRCLGFAEIFKNDPNTTEMEIEDMSADGIEEFLRFFYTGSFSGDTKYAEEIFELASKFKAPEVKKIAGKMFLIDLNELNAYKIFKLGHSHDFDELKVAAFDKIREMIPERKLPDNSIENLEIVRKLIDHKEKMDALVNKCKEFKIGYFKI